MAGEHCTDLMRRQHTAGEVMSAGTHPEEKGRIRDNVKANKSRQTSELFAWGRWPEAWFGLCTCQAIPDLGLEVRMLVQQPKQIQACPRLAVAVRRNVSAEGEPYCG